MEKSVNPRSSVDVFGHFWSWMVYFVLENTWSGWYAYNIRRVWGRAWWHALFITLFYYNLLNFTIFYLNIPDPADIIKLPKEMKDAQRRLRWSSLLFCCVGRRLMALRRDWGKNNIKTIWRVILAEKVALTYWGKVSVLLGILWAERKDDLLCGGK